MQIASLPIIAKRQSWRIVTKTEQEGTRLKQPHHHHALFLLSICTNSCPGDFKTKAGPMKTLSNTHIHNVFLQSTYLLHGGSGALCK